VNDRERDVPAIVTHRIPRIEVYQVTDDELRRIEDGSNQVAQDLAFALACSSFCIAFIIALTTGTFNSSAGVTLTIAALIFGLAAIYTGTRWWRHRSSAPNVIASIRRRRVDPETQNKQD